MTAALIAALFSALASADMIETAGAPSDFRTATAFFTPAVVEQLAGRIGERAEVRQVSEEEAIVAAAARGAKLERSKANFGHPWFIIKTGIGMPGMLSADVEIYLSANVTVEAGIGANLGSSVYTGTVRWRPDATCFGCHGHNMLSIGFGLEGGVIPTATGVHMGIFLMPQVDLMYVHRFAAHFGWVLGLRAGFGPEYLLRRNENYPEVGNQFDTQLDVLLYTGFQF